MRYNHACGMVSCEHLLEGLSESLFLFAVVSPPFLLFQQTLTLLSQFNYFLFRLPRNHVAN
jgi:hypothetical protein